MPHRGYWLVKTSGGWAVEDEGQVLAVHTTHTAAVAHLDRLQKSGDPRGEMSGGEESGGEASGEQASGGPASGPEALASPGTPKSDAFFRRFS